MVSHWEEHDACETLIAAVFAEDLYVDIEDRHSGNRL